MTSTIKQSAALFAVLYIVVGALHSIAFDWIIPRSACLKATGLVSIYCNSGTGISHFVVTLAWPLYWLQPNQSHAQNLSGADRQQFLAGAINSCMRGHGKDGTDAIPRPFFEMYCQCYANGLADKLSAKELKEENPAVVRPVIQSEGRRCYALIKEEAMRRIKQRSN